MKLTAVLLSSAVLLLLIVPAASAQDNDPSIFSNGKNCIGAGWCESSTLATDPISGDTGVVEYIFKTAAQGGADPTFVTGDVDMSDGYVLRFEMNGTTPEVFILNGPVNAFTTSSSPTPAGANELSETSAALNVSALWTPGVGQVGYDSVDTGQEYGFQVLSPEPTSILLMGAGLGLLGLGARKRMRTN